jgi:biopolymer transport protein ExbD
MEIQRPKKGSRADINVTPLIDVVLVMLIIFMVLAPSLLKHMVVTIPRPAPADAVVHRGLPPITVAYSEARQITLNDEPVAFEALASRVAHKLRFDQRKLVFFRVEDAAAYGEVIKLMDTVRGAGANTLAIVPATP